MIGQTLGDRYRIDGRIGTGGMAQVYRARDLRLERDVAVKVLASDLKSDPSYVKRFVQEAKLSAKVRHPNLVEVFDVALSEGEGVYLVMELLAGKSLGALIGTRGLAVSRFFHIAKGITLGLRGLHAARIVHRDLSANNVMLVHHGDEVEHVKVLDLGIAKAEGQATLTEPGSFIGTLESMPPEQIRGDVLTPAADVYALGVLFFRMLTGKPPFAGEAATLLYQHLEVRPPPLHERSDVAIPPRLGALVARCLEKEPGARFDDASALHDALVDAESDPEEAATTPNEQIPSAAGEVPDLAFPATRAPSAPSAASLRPRTEPEPSRRREAVLELDDDATSEPLELAPVSRRTEPPLPIDVVRCAGCGSSLHAGAVVCSVCGARPSAAVTPFRRGQLAERPRLPGWLAPVGTLPVTVGKRVAAYSFLGAILTAIFAHSLVLPCGLFAVSVVAAIGVYVRSRLDDEP